MRRLTPLWIISLFVSLTEAVLGVAVTQTSGGIQITLTGFVVAFPVLVLCAFFAVLWNRPWVFYSPGEYGNLDFTNYIDALSKAQGKAVVTRTADVQGERKIIGDPDRFRLLFKVAGPTWKKSTKAMDVGTGCVVQVTTEVTSPTGSVSVAEALTFVPDVEVVVDPSSEGAQLRPKGRGP